MLKFSSANAKLKKLYKVPEVKAHLKGRKIYSFDLPAGKSCPSALLCKSKATLKDGKIKVIDGDSCQFRCYAASQEALYKNVYSLRDHNFKLLRGKTSRQIRDLIEMSLPECGLLRIHSSGDFFCKPYFLAWLDVIQKHKDVWFYAYTKQIPYLVEFSKTIDELSNFVTTASYGGKHDSIILENKLKYAKVVYSEQEAERLQLPIDFDDSYAACPSKKFVSSGLLLHGQMPKGSPAQKALQLIKKGIKNGSRKPAK